MSLTVSINGSAQDTVAWGLSDCKLTYGNFAPDTFEATSVPSSSDETALMPHDAVVAVSIDGTLRFVGVSHNPRLVMDGSTWRWHYTCHNAWYDMGRTMMQQTWTRLDGDTDTTQEADSAIIVFGAWYSTYQDEDTLLTKTATHQIATDVMLTKTIEYAASTGISVEVGTILTGINVPSWTAQDITIAAALQAICKWHPTAVTKWDYTTDIPTLSIQIADSTSATAFSTSSSSLMSLDVAPRYDLLISGCIIRYLRSKTLTQAKIQAASGNYVWILYTTAEQHGYEILDTRTATYNYTTSYGAGDVVTSDMIRGWAMDEDNGIISAPVPPGVLIYSIDWRNYTYSPPADAATAIYNESSTLQYEGQIVWQSSSMPWDMGTGLAGGYVTGISYDYDNELWTYTIGPFGGLGQDWVDLLARRIEPTNATITTIVMSGSDGSVDDSPLTDDEADTIAQFGNYREEKSVKVYSDGVRQIIELVRDPTEEDTNL